MIVKAMAAKEVLHFALGLGIRAIILEGNAKLVLDNFEESTMDLSRNDTILADAYGLTFRFNFFKANFIPRRCNMVASRPS